MHVKLSYQLCIFSFFPFILTCRDLLCLSYVAQRFCPPFLALVAFVRETKIGGNVWRKLLQIGGNNQSKRVFWIDGGIHAREWAAPHTALYFIHQLTSKYGHDAQITKYVEELTWVIVPCLNPDGYEFTRSSTNPNVSFAKFLIEYTKRLLLYNTIKSNDFRESKRVQRKSTLFPLPFVFAFLNSFIQNLYWSNEKNDC